MEMITIMVHFSGVLAEMTGIKDDEWEIPKGLTYTQLLEGFKSEYGEEVYNYLKNPTGTLMVYLNGTHGNKLGGHSMTFNNNGDSLSIMAPFGKVVMLKDVGGAGAF